MSPRLDPIVRVRKGAAHKLAIENEHIAADVIEVSEFIDIAQLYRVQGVPKTVINERIEVLGAVPEPRFAREPQRALAPKETSEQKAGSEVMLSLTPRLLL